MSLDLNILVNEGAEVLHDFVSKEAGVEPLTSDSQWGFYVSALQLSVECGQIEQHPRIVKYHNDLFGISFGLRISISMSKLLNPADGLSMMRRMGHELRRGGFDFVMEYDGEPFLFYIKGNLSPFVDRNLSSERQARWNELATWFIEEKSTKSVRDL